MFHSTHCHVQPFQPTAGPPARRTARTIHLALAGMECNNCATRVLNALLGLDGVITVEVDLPASLAKIWYLVDRLDEIDLMSAVRDAGRDTDHGYLAVPVRSRFAVEEG